MPNFQEKIKGLRIERGLTQKQLADLLNVSQNAVYNWENGKREPSMDMQKKIAKIFDIALYMLLDDNFSLPDTTLEAGKKRARFVGDTTMEKPPIFTVPANNEEPVSTEYTIQVNIDRNSSLNIALKKLDNGQPLTSKESHLIKEYITSDIFRENLAQLPAKFKGLSEVLRQNYELLNTEGQEKANEQIKHAAEQIELLTKIPEYQKKNEE